MGAPGTDRRNTQNRDSFAARQWLQRTAGRSGSGGTRSQFSLSSNAPRTRRLQRRVIGVTHPYPTPHPHATTVSRTYTKPRRRGFGQVPTCSQPSSTSLRAGLDMLHASSTGRGPGPHLPPTLANQAIELLGVCMTCGFRRFGAGVDRVEASLAKDRPGDEQLGVWSSRLLRQWSGGLCGRLGSGGPFSSRQGIGGHLVELVEKAEKLGIQVGGQIRIH